MRYKCYNCGKKVEVWEPHKLLDKGVCCIKCLEEENKEAYLSYRIEKFLKLRADKVALTFLMYITMFFYNFIFYIPIVKTPDKITQTIAQIGFVLNFPIISFSNLIRIQNDYLLILVVSVTTITVLFWNYLISCEIYYLYETLIKKKYKSH